MQSDRKIRKKRIDFKSIPSRIVTLCSRWKPARLNQCLSLLACCTCLLLPLIYIIEPPKLMWAFSWHPVIAFDQSTLLIANESKSRREAKELQESPSNLEKESHSQPSKLQDPSKSIKQSNKTESTGSINRPSQSPRSREKRQGNFKVGGKKPKQKKRDEANAKITDSFQNPETSPPPSVNNFRMEIKEIKEDKKPNKVHMEKNMGLSYEGSTFFPIQETESTLIEEDREYKEKLRKRDRLRKFSEEGENEETEDYLEDQIFGPKNKGQILFIPPYTPFFSFSFKFTYFFILTKKMLRFFFISQIKPSFFKAIFPNYPPEEYKNKPEMYRISCASSRNFWAYECINGKVYFHKFDGTNEVTIEGDSQIYSKKNQNFSPLHSSKRYGKKFNYIFPVQNGIYSVRIILSELYLNGTKVENAFISVNGNQVPKRVDFSGPKNGVFSTPYFETKVDSEELRVDFFGESYGLCNGIEILPQSEFFL